MDSISHVVSAAIVAVIFKLGWQGCVLVIIGSLLPDVIAPAILRYYGWNNMTKQGKYRQKPLPEKLFRIYDFLHSFLFIAIMLFISIFINQLYLVVIGLLLHMLLDVPTHKWRGIGVFFPSKYLVKGFFNWIDVYRWFKARIKFLP